MEGGGGGGGGGGGLNREERLTNKLVKAKN